MITKNDSIITIPFITSVLQNNDRAMTDNIRSKISSVKKI
jgi:hypothetical protein